MSSTTTSTNLKYSIVILFTVILGMSFYIINKNTTQKTVESFQKIDQIGKNNILKDLEFLKDKYDEVISDNVSLTDEIFLEREKVAILIAEIKNNNSSNYYKKRLVEAKSKMNVLLNENFKLKDQKIIVENQKNDTVFSSYEKLYYQSKNLQKQNEDLTNLVKKGSLLSITNLSATSFKTKNSGKLVLSQFAKRADLLKITYTINENLLSKSGEKTFYTQIVDPKNNVVSEIKSLQAENELRYTFANKVEYANKSIEINQSLPFKSFMKGKYWITIFDYNGVIGKSSFIMK